MKLKRGDVREDGKVFRGYRKYKGEIKESWATREMFDRSVLCVREGYKKWRDRNPEKAKSAYSNWAKRNSDKAKSSYRNWSAKNPGKAKAAYQNWCKSNPGKAKAASKAWKDANPERVKATYQKWMDAKPIRKVAASCRSRVRQGLYGKRTKSTPEYIGCSWDELLIHLEAQFVEGMTWENYGHGWHVDHIKPLCSADSLEELLPLLHYSNLQPLWAKDNLSKGGRF